MREDIKQIIRQYRHEIITFDDLFDDVHVVEIEDWWHYLDDIAINVHDYDEDGIISVNIFDCDEDGFAIDMIDNYEFTIEEFKKL